MTALLIVHLVICGLLILIVLLQPSSGMDLGTAFGGSGSSDSLFGSKGSSGFFVKVTAVLAGIFMILSVFMSYNIKKGKSSVVENIKVKPAKTQQAPIIPTIPVKK